MEALNSVEQISKLDGASAAPFEVEAHADRERWLAARKGRIGASEAAIVLGLNPYASPYSLWAEFVGLAVRREATEAMSWGNILEPVIADEFARRTGADLNDYGRHTILVSKAHPFMSCTLDRVIVSMDGQPRPGPGVLEIKAVGVPRAGEWGDEPPIYYQVQLQHQLAVTGYRWGVLCVLIAGQELRWFVIERNDAFIEVLIPQLAEFARRVVEHQPPQVDGKDATIETLKQMLPSDNGEAIALPPDAEQWDEEIAKASEIIDAQEARIKEAKAKIMSAIGEATYGVLPGNRGRWQWKQKTQERKATEAKTITYRELRRLAK